MSDSNGVAAAAVKRQQKKPEIARQLAQRSRKKADGGVHEVDRGIAASRKQEAAEVNEVQRPPVKRWQKASALPGMPDLPGYHLEYVRKDNQHKGDNENLIAHLSEGWECARKTDFPRAVLPTQRLSDHGEVIGNASMILMKIPLELKAQRDEHYANRRNMTTASINKPDPTLGGVVNTDVMPIVEDKIKISVSNETHKVRRMQPRVAADV